MAKRVAELAVLLQWRPGDIVADIGAGKGKLTVFTAERIGPSGRVYGTEMDREKFAALQELAGSHTNITTIKASDSDTNLPDLSCDSIYMRLVYHHFTKPNDMDSSLFRSLKHKGRLAIIDEEPVKGTTIPEGVPKNRLGHGIPQKVLISKLKHPASRYKPSKKSGRVVMLHTRCTVLFSSNVNVIDRVVFRGLRQFLGLLPFG